MVALEAEVMGCKTASDVEKIFKFFVPFCLVATLNQQKKILFCIVHH